MKQLPSLPLIFAVVFLLFFFAPPLLGKPFSPYPLMKIADVFDIFTPLVLLPLYWLLFRSGHKELLNLPSTLAFLVFVGFWAVGHGMHLSANSINHLLKGMESTDIYGLTYFYDEVLSHYLWHFGVVGLSAVIIFYQWQSTIDAEKTTLWPLILAGFIHGFSLFSIVLEGGTAPMGITFSILVIIFGLIWGLRSMRQKPLFLFFFISYSLCVILLVGWGIYWRGLPQFSELGII
jgi:hypothetical protein